jgi:hypothetical protein
MEMTTNTYMDDCGIGGLLRNLLGNDPTHGTEFPDDVDLNRVDAIRQQAWNVKKQALLGLQALGAAVAAAGDELDRDQAVQAGHLTQFLAELADTMDHYEDLSRDLINNGKRF